MTVLPVVDRELRVASRRRWSYWGRSVAAAVVLLVVAWFVVVERSLSLNQFGHQLFGVTTFLAAAFALLAGVIYTADSMAIERRDGTLGLLFLTDLKGYDVLFGKMAASSLGCLFHLVASFPIMAIAILMGGVTAGEYLRMMALLFNVVFCSLSLGMLASTLSPDSKRAAALALAFVVALAGLMPALGGIVYWLGWKLDVPEEVRDRYFAEGFGWESPVVAYFGAFDNAYGSRPMAYQFGMAYVGVVALLALALSAFRLPRIWQDKSSAVARRGFHGRIENLRWPDVAARAAWRTRLLESSPMVWLSGRYWMRGVSVWILLAVCAVIFGIFGLEIGKEWFEAPTFITTSILVHLALKLWIASEAPRQFHDDRRSGGMELLLSTPLMVEEIVEGRMRAIQRQFGGPIFLVLVVDVVFLLTGIKWGSDNSAGEWSLFWVSRMILLVLDAYAMGWSGMWIGMKVSGNRTTGHVLLRIVIVPWLVVAVLLTFVGLLSISGSSPFSGSGFPGALVLWLLLCTFNDIFWLATARRHLLASFRDLGTSRPGEKKSVPPA
jgi:ABC-type transport system involved in multi-copper enzyme maturation permease subunit